MTRKLFIEGVNPDSRACFGWQDISTGLYGIKEGYYNSAIELVDIALKNGGNGRVDVLDQYVFPIVFLFRHSIEASIKLVYFRVKGRIALGGHDLINLWNNLYNDIINSTDYPSILSSLSYVNFNGIKDLLSEFNNVDKGSDVFRYLIDNKARKYFTQQKFIDYSNLKETMDYLYSNFGAIYHTIDEMFSA